MESCRNATTSVTVGLLNLEPSRNRKGQMLGAMYQLTGGAVSIKQGFLDPADSGIKQKLLKSSSYKGSPDIHAS